MPFLNIKSRDIEDFINILFTTGLIGVILLYISSYALVATGWTLILEKFTPSLSGNIPFTRAFSAIDIVIGFIYFTWLNKSFLGYTRTVSQNLKLNQQVRVFSEKFFGIFESEKSWQQLLGSKSSGKEKTTEIELHEYIQDMRILLQSLIFHGYAIFTTKIFNDTYKPNFNGISRNLTNGLNAINESNTIEIEHELIKLIRTNIHLMKKEGFLLDVDIQDLEKNLNIIIEIIDHIDLGQTVIEPDLFNNHIGFTLLLYFGLWTPVAMWISFGVAITIIIYPIVIFILTGPVIYRSWLGDPFDPQRPIRLGEHLQWRNDYIAKIGQHARKSLEIKSY